MRVNAPAASWDNPLLSATLDWIESNEPPGWNSIGQTDWPNAIAVAGWLYGTPAFVRAIRNALFTMSARIGAASVAAAAAIPAVNARKRTAGAHITVTTVVKHGHTEDTME
jgi:hypothetical protein